MKKFTLNFGPYFSTVHYANSFVDAVKDVEKVFNDINREDFTGCTIEATNIVHIDNIETDNFIPIEVKTVCLEKGSLYKTFAFDELSNCVYEKTSRTLQQAYTMHKGAIMVVGRSRYVSAYATGDTPKLVRR